MDKVARHKVSDHFYADEFLCPGETDIKKVDNKLIVVAEWLRNTLGKPVSINNYATGGSRSESGLRTITTKTGAKKSAHKPLPEHGGICKAIDIHVDGMTAKQVYDFCLEKQMELYAMGIREIEDHEATPTWTHLATRGKWLAIKIIKP